MANTIALDGKSLTLDDLVKISRENAKIKVVSKDAVKRSRKRVEKVIKGERAVYGINTGFGALLNTIIPQTKLAKLQEKLILSHAMEAGDILSKEETRAMMALRTNNLCRGYSGIRPEQSIRFGYEKDDPLVQSSPEVGYDYI